MNNRFKNVYFWCGLIGVVFAAGGVTFESLTSWKLFLDGILSILNNPVALLATFMAVVGVFVEPTSKGLYDEVGE